MEEILFSEGAGHPPSSSAPVVNHQNFQKMPALSSKNQKISVFLGLMVSILYVKLILLLENTFYRKWILVFFFVCFFAAVETCARLFSQPRNKESGLWAAIMLLIPAGCAVFPQNSETLSPWAGLFTHLSAAQFALVRLGGAAQPQTGAFLPLDMIRAWFILPFGNFFKNIQLLFCGIKIRLPQNKAKRAVPIALGVLIGFPILVWIGSILVNADVAFQLAIEKWFLNFSFEHLFSVMFGWIDGFSVFLYTFFWCWFYGLFYGAYQRKYNTNSLKTDTIYSFCEKIRILPKESAVTILVLLSGLYMLFFITQLQYFTMGFVGVVPQGYTVAEYARQGFFELIRVSAVNLSVLAVVAKTIKQPIRNNKSTKWLSGVLMVFNLAFSVVSFSKLGLYVGFFGLTPKRLLAGYAICVIAVWSILAVCTLKKPFRAVMWAVRFAAVLFCVMCFIDWQKIIFWLQQIV